MCRFFSFGRNLTGFRSSQHYTVAITEVMIDRLFQLRRAARQLLTCKMTSTSSRLAHGHARIIVVCKPYWRRIVSYHGSYASTYLQKHPAVCGEGVHTRNNGYLLYSCVHSVTLVHFIRTAIHVHVYTVCPSHSEHTEGRFLGSLCSSGLILKNEHQTTDV